MGWVWEGISAKRRQWRMQRAEIEEAAGELPTKAGKATFAATVGGQRGRFASCCRTQGTISFREYAPAGAEDGRGDGVACRQTQRDTFFSRKESIPLDTRKKKVLCELDSASSRQLRLLGNGRYILRLSPLPLPWWYAESLVA